MRQERRRRTGTVHADLDGLREELEYHLLLTRDPGYLDASDYERLASKTQEVKRMLAPFINRLKE